MANRTFAVMVGCLIALHTALHVEAACQDESTEDPSGFFQQWLRSKQSSSGFRPVQSWLQSQSHERLRLPSWKAENATAPFTSCEYIGPTNVGGRTRALLTVGDNVFAGSVGGGLWRSRNQAQDWAPVDGNDQFGSMIISCIAQNPLSQDIIYFGTGEPFKESFYGGGVFRSDDRGNSFDVLPSTETDARFIYCLCIAHSKTHSHTIYVGNKAPAHIQNRRAFGLVRSTDNGRSWQTVIGNQTVSDVETFTDGSVLASCMGSGIYYSPTGAAGSFRRVESSEFPNSFQLVELACCQAAPNIVYAIFEGPETQDPGSTRRRSKIDSVFRSQDGGLTWELRSNAAEGSRDPNNKLYQTGAETHSNYCFDVVVHPLNSDMLVCGTVILCFSEDGGVSWKRAGYSESIDFHAFATDGATSKQLFVGCDRGVWRYDWDDMQREAVSLNRNYNVTQFYAGAFFDDSAAAVGGLRDNGTRRTTDSCTLTASGDGGFCYISRDEDWALLSDDHMKVHLNVDPARPVRTHGLWFVESFPKVGPIETRARPFPEEMISEGFDYMNRFIVNSADECQIYCRTDRSIWRSVDRGETWSRMSKDDISGIHALACCEHPNPTLFVGGLASGDRTCRFGRAPSDRAFLWQFVAANSSAPGSERDLTATIPFMVSEDSLACIEPSPLSPDEVFVGFSNYGTCSRIWRVEGLTDSLQRVRWRDISGNLTGQWRDSNGVNTIAVDPARPNSHVFLGTDRGLYYTTNGGQYWSRFVSIPNTMIMQLKMRVSDRSLFVFTHGRGVWRLELD